MVEGKIKTIVISHFDSDHWGGLKNLYYKDEFSAYFKTNKVFHNGLFLTKKGEDEVIGKTIAGAGAEFFEDTILDKGGLAAFAEKYGGEKQTGYTKLMMEIMKKTPDTDIRILSAGSDALNKEITPVDELAMEILAPVLCDVQSKKLLRKFDGDVGIQKNGHSVVIKIKYKNVTILLPGDINDEAEAFLLDHYKQKKEIFCADVYKVAHHGSSNFADDFAYAVKPFAYVISSGDNEQHSHPRPDTLGFLGKAARGSRPLIFCTELARSTKEELKTPEGLRTKINAALKEYESARTKEKKDKLEKLLDKLEKSLNRSISVYGAINLRTDGHKILFSQKLEAKRGDLEWDIYRLEPGAGGLVLVRK